MLKSVLKLMLMCLLWSSFAPVATAQSGNNGVSLEQFSDFQKKKKKKKKKKKNEEEKEKIPFKDHLWYGAGIGLGFSAFQNQSAFGFGISPMAGYKFTKWLSAGPRLSVFYTSQKYTGYKAVNLFDTEVGGFLRIHAFRGFFIQGELSESWNQEPYDLGPNNTILKYSFSRFNQYVGLGYNFSRGEGGVGQEISLMYNFAIANDVNTSEQPIQYRLAFTYGF